MSIVLTGASGVVGVPLYRLLSREGHTVIKTSRSRSGNGWIKMDLEKSERFDTSANILVHCAPIWLLAPHVSEFYEKGVRRIIAMSSTSVVSKKDSKDPKDRLLAKRLIEGERQVRERTENHRIDLTLFRPTMIYGYGRDSNISEMARFIQRYRFFPLAGAASGIRRPLHCDDLAAAVYRVLELPVTFGKIYDLSGGERLSYRDMVIRIFGALDVPVRILTLPTTLLKYAIVCLALIRRGVSTGMIDRMNTDLDFAHEQSRYDFGFTPAKFLPNGKRDLVKR